MAETSTSSRTKTNIQRRIILRLLFFFFLALVIPVVFGTGVYLVQIRGVEREILNNRMVMLDLNRAIVESAILSVEQAVNEIRQDERISALLSLEDPLGSRALLQVRDAYRESRLADSAPDYLIDIVVYLSKPDVLFSTIDVFFDPSIYYRYFLQVEDERYDEWIGQLRSRTYLRNLVEFTDLTFKGTSRDAFVVRNSLPLSTRFEREGAIIAYIDRHAIKGLLEEYLVSETGFAYVQLPDERVLASAGTVDHPLIETPLLRPLAQDVIFQNIDGREYAISYIRSELNQWTYVVGTPIEVFYSQSRRIRIIFFGLLALVTLVGVPLLVFQVAGFARPIAKMSRVLRDGVVLSERVDGDPVTLISDSVDELIKRDRSLRELLEEQEPFVRRVIIDRLFRGDFATDTQARTYLTHYGVTIPSSRTHVLCVLIEGYFDVVTPEILREFTVKSALVREELAGVLPPDTLIHNISHNVIAIALLVADESTTDSLSESADSTVSLLASRLRSLKDVKCTVTTGGVAEEITMISSRVQSAIQLAERVEPGAVVFSEPETAIDGGYYYPTELEADLIRCVRAGDGQSVRSIATEIAKENFRNRRLSRESVRGLFHEVDATYSKLIRLQVVPGSGSPLRSAGLDLEHRVKLLLDSMARLADKKSRDGTTDSPLKEPIAQFVRENALNTEMGLKLLAMHFNLSEVYVSKLFRELFGENFHNYVERIRMEHATQLLRTSRLTIEQIAERVGYQSANTFRRVFKRTYGISPSSYDRSGISAS